MTAPAASPNAPMREAHLRRDAHLAPDGIPLDFGSAAREFAAAHEAAILLDRSHEGRLELEGKDALGLLHRISTHDMLSMLPGAVRPTIFTNPNGRILDRVTVYREPEAAGASIFLITEPGRGEAVRAYLQRNIFFNDDVRVRDISAHTRQFALHGLHARDIVQRLLPDAPLAESGAEWPTPGGHMAVLRVKPLIASASSWVVMVENDGAPLVWDQLLEQGAAHGLMPAGSLAYNLLRVQVGRPAAGREITSDYIPLEIGLWDEVSFTKGCYTGQEIIARMESRGRQAKVLFTAQAAAPLDAPQTLYDADGREAGTVTSAVTLPSGEHRALAVVRTAHAEPDTVLFAGDGRISVTLIDVAGVQGKHGELQKY